MVFFIFVGIGSLKRVVHMKILKIVAHHTRGNTDDILFKVQLHQTHEKKHIIDYS